MTQPRLPEFADSLDVTILLHQAESDTILDANAAAESLYGYTVTELRGIEIEEVSTESPQFSQTRARERIQAAADGERLDFEWQIRRKDSELRWVNVQLRPTTIDGEACVLAEIQDITEFKKRTRRLKLLYRIIRHNLRNEMSVVMGHAEHLQEALADEDYERQAELIHSVAKDVSGMTESVSRIEELASNDETDFVPTNVVDVLQQFVDTFESEYPQATLEVETPTEVWISADSGLHYGIENAVENAIVHNDTETPTVRLTAERTDSKAVVRIVDDGPHIPDAEVDAVDATEDVTDLHHGTGVGLFVMKWCAESLGGKLDIHPAEGERGNVVQFTFPLLDHREKEGAHSAGPNTAQSVGDGERSTSPD